MWDIIIVLGKKAVQHEDNAGKLHSCDRILGKIYHYKENNAMNELSKASNLERDNKICEITEYLEEEKKYQVEGVNEREEQFKSLYLRKKSD